MQFDLTSSPTCPLGSLWRDAYRAPTSSALRRHFGHSGGITQLFPCMRDQYKWGAGRPDVLDARVPIKNNTEYHGLELHARQWFATAKYEEAFEHWLLAADWRSEDMLANSFKDQGHVAAIDFALRNAAYSHFLHQDGWWGVMWAEDLPSAHLFGLDDARIKATVRKTLDDMSQYLRARGAPDPGWLYPST
jgi:hypothetical protein